MSRWKRAELVFNRWGLNLTGVLVVTAMMAFASLIVWNLLPLLIVLPLFFFAAVTSKIADKAYYDE